MTAEVLLALAAVAIGYLLGSVLPADLLARSRGVDIRTVGDGNPGTANAFKGLGWPYGVLTALYDASVGLLAIMIARRLGVSEGASYLAGIATIAGHRFPVFARFQGGQGMAASAAMLLYGTDVAFRRGWLSAAEIAVLFAVAVITLVWTRSDRPIAIVVLPVLLLMLVVARPDWQYVAFMAIVAGNIWVVQLAFVRHHVGSVAVRH